MVLSYSHGASAVPLIGQTIGDNLAETARRFPDAEALVVSHQGVRLTYRELAAEVERVARGLLSFGLGKGDRVGIWSPNNAEWVLAQYATAVIGVVLVNINPAYRTHEVEYVLRQSGCRMLLVGHRVQDERLRRHGGRGAAAAARAGDRGLPRHARLGRPAGPGRRCAARRGGRAGGPARLRRRHQHPVHERHDRLPEGRHAQPPQHPEQRLLHRRGLRLHRARPRVRPRALLPLLRDGAREPGLHHPRRLHRGAGAVRSSPSPRWQAVEAERCTSLYGVPTMFIAELALPDFARYDLSSLRTGIMAGSPCPVEVMKRCIGEMHMEEVTICYGMTETSPVSTQTLDRRPDRQAGGHRGPGPSPRRGQGGRSGDRSGGGTGRARASCAPVATR